MRFLESNGRIYYFLLSLVLQQLLIQRTARYFLKSLIHKPFKKYLGLGLSAKRCRIAIDGQANPTTLNYDNMTNNLTNSSASELTDTNSKLFGKKVIITGASSGIGEEVAIRLCQHGATVSLISRHPDRLLPNLPDNSKVKGYAIDLSDVQQVASQIKAIVTAMDGVDILINNAGMAYIGELIDMPLPEWQKLFDLNLTSVFQCIQAVLPTMRSQKNGTIVNVASIAARQGFPNWGAYCASKFALLGLTQALAAEEQPHGIKVMSICPGSVDTPLWDTLGDKVPANFNRAAMLRPATVAESIMTLLLLPSDATISDLVIMPSAGVF
jgi:NADP-dependent 3-hydroxy acid dehydrogenase YdfG